MSLRGKAAIVGIGEFRPTRYTEGATTLGMLAEVGREAIADAGLEMGEVDGLITESFAEAPFMAPSTVVEYLGLKREVRRGRRPRRRDRRGHGLARRMPPSAPGSARRSFA